MRDIAVLVPGRIDTRSGGYEYDRRIVAGLRERGWHVAVHELEGTFPRPTAAALERADAVLAGIPEGATVIVDGLALGAMPDQIARAAVRTNIVALVHLPLGDDPALDAASAAALRPSERRALAAASLVVVTGQETAVRLKRLGVPADRLAVVEPGTDRAALAQGSVRGPLHLLAVGALTPGKGHDILIRALAAVPCRDWVLTCAGSLDRDPVTVTRVRASISANDLESRVILAGELDAAALDACYLTADVFVLATLHETFCMAVAEALAHGLPVVSTRTGAIPLLVREEDEALRAGVLAPPGDVRAMTSALGAVIGDAGLRARLAVGARRVRDVLPTWDDTVDRMAAALARVTSTRDVA